MFWKVQLTFVTKGKKNTHRVTRRFTDFQGTIWSHLSGRQHTLCPFFWGHAWHKTHRPSTADRAGLLQELFLLQEFLWKSKLMYVLRRAVRTIPGGLCNSNPRSFLLISTYRPMFFKDQMLKLGVFFRLPRGKELQSWHFFKHIYIQLETRHFITD